MGRSTTGLLADDVKFEVDPTLDIVRHVVLILSYRYVM